MDGRRVGGSLEELSTPGADDGREALRRAQAAVGQRDITADGVTSVRQSGVGAPYGSEEDSLSLQQAAGRVWLTVTPPPCF